MGQILTPKRDSVEATSEPDSSWQVAMKTAIRSGGELCEQLGISPQLANPTAAADFPVFAPRGFVARMTPGHVDDPLLLQVLNQSAELDDSGSRNPVGEIGSSTHSGLLQKYSGRALLVVNGTCAIHCRYCFRRHYPYSAAGVGKEAWSASLQQIQNDPSIKEVILSGGDPLTLSNTNFSWLCNSVAEIGHVQRLRIHTRLPIVIPERIDAKLLETLETSEKEVVMVVHCNHAQELDANVSKTLLGLRAKVNHLLNQTVLLRGVNDSLTALADLSDSLLSAGVLPYYLHQLDPVQGGMHFEVDEERAIELVNQMRNTLPGYAVPKLVREEAGQSSKTPLL